MLDNITPKGKQQHEYKLTIENSVKLDPQFPIPTQYVNEYFYTVTNKKYIPFLGKKDNLANVFLEVRLTSTTHHACISTIAQSVIGNGVYVRDEQTPDEDFVTWMKNVNNHSHSFDEVLQQTVDGERAYGNQFVEVVRGEINQKKFVKLYTHSTLFCRLSEPDTETDMCKSVFISKLFARKGARAVDVSKAREIPLWNGNILDQNTVWIKNPDGTESTMLHFKNEVSGIDYYGLPSSVGSFRDQVLEGRYSQHDLDDLDNNMILGGIITFKSSMTQEEAQKNAKEILLSHVGEGKTGRWAVMTSEQGIQDVEITPYTTQKDGSFIAANKKSEDKIIKSHGWDSILAGTTESGSLGKGSGYIRAIWDAKEASLLNPLRRKLLDKVIVPIMKIYSDWIGKKEILKYDLWFNSSMPFSFMSDIKPESFIQVNEARELGGMEADDNKKGVYLSEMTKSTNSNVQGDSATA